MIGGLPPNLQDWYDHSVMDRLLRICRFVVVLGLVVAIGLDTDCRADPASHEDSPRPEQPSLSPSRSETKSAPAPREVPNATRETADAKPGEAADIDDSEDDAEAPETPRTPKKSPFRRSGWVDLHFFYKYRIQRHVERETHRLLDGANMVLATGEFAQCQSKLDEIRKERRLERMQGEAVIAIHGLNRSSKSMRALEGAGGLEDAGFQVFYFDYPSTRLDLKETASYLHRAIESLDGIEKIHFVVHSMGGLVVRTYLSEHDDPRLGRLVMIATPNQGAHLADRFSSMVFYKALLGPAGQQLNRGQESFVSSLPAPKLEFGIIAGGRGGAGYSPLIPGDDDGIVSVDSTRLAGAADFITIRRTHTALLQDADCRECTVRFLKSGRFQEPEPSDP
jgi:pimeloyl-ACP methyl ester carboxylesterase